MADQSMNINNPVKIESDSKARVAFDLMNKIVTYTATDAQKKDPKYWFTLYVQCHKAASGSNLKYTLQED